MHRSVIEFIEAYDPGIFPQDVEERYEVDPGSVVNLASNENPYPPPQAVLERIRSVSIEANRYPDPTYRQLKSALSKYVEQPEERIAVGSGSTEILDMVCKVFLEPFDKIVLASPSYSMYVLMGMLRDARVEFIETAQRGFRLEAAPLLDLGADAKLIFLCSPNNPTGLTIKRKDIERILREAQGIVVMDEAYSEFSGTSVAEMVPDHPNLIVTRSMSKFFSLAGLRVGYALSGEDVVSDLEKVRNPFSITRISEQAAISALCHLDHYEMVKEQILAERRMLFRELRRMDYVKPYPSSANFIMMSIDGVDFDVVEQLARRGVLVRDLRGVPGLEGDFIRVTVGKHEENAIFLDSLRKILSP